MQVDFALLFHIKSYYAEGIITTAVTVTRTLQHVWRIILIIVIRIKYETFTRILIILIFLVILANHY